MKFNYEVTYTRTYEGTLDQPTEAEAREALNDFDPEDDQWVFAGVPTRVIEYVERDFDDEPDDEEDA